MHLGHCDTFGGTDSHENLPDGLTDIWCEVPSEEFGNQRIDSRKVVGELRNSQRGHGVPLARPTD